MDSSRSGFHPGRLKRIEPALILVYRCGGLADDRGGVLIVRCNAVLGPSTLRLMTEKIIDALLLAVLVAFVVLVFRRLRGSRIATHN